MTVSITVSAKDPLKSQRPSHRARQFRVAAHTALVELGIRAVDHEIHTIAPDRVVARLDRWIAIADVDGSVSSSGHGPEWLMDSIAHLDGLRAEFVSANDILGGALDRFDAVVFPGGSSSRQGRALGTEGRNIVRAFVRDGGGYVGICAGAFLACADSPHDLDLIDAADESAAGSGVVMLELDADHAAAIGVSIHAPVKHSGGPRMMLGQGDRPETHDDATHHPWGETRVLATYTEDLERNDGRITQLAGYPAVIEARYGAGLVFAIGPHPERAPGPQELFWAALRETSARR